MYKKDLALNNLQWLACYKTKPNQNTFLKVISLKVYAIVRQDFELTQFKATFPVFSHYPTTTLPFIIYESN